MKTLDSEELYIAALASEDYIHQFGLFEDEPEELYRVYEHLVSTYRFAIPYDSVTPETRSDYRLKRRIINAARHLYYNRFISLDYRDSALPAMTKQISYAMHSMRVYHRKMNIGTKKLFPYFYRLEFGPKNGRPHWHILCRTDYIQNKQMDNWWPHGNHDIRVVKNVSSAIGYITKYMCKSTPNIDNHDLSGLKRRWGCASKITPKTPPTEYRLATICDKSFLEEEVALHNIMLIEDDHDPIVEIPPVVSVPQFNYHCSDSVAMTKYFPSSIPLVNSRSSNGKVFIQHRLDY